MTLQIEKDGYVRVLPSPETCAKGLAGRIFRVLDGPIDPPAAIMRALGVVAPGSEHRLCVIDAFQVTGVCSCMLEPVDMTHAPGFEKFINAALFKPVDLHGNS